MCSVLIESVRVLLTSVETIFLNFYLALSSVRDTLNPSMCAEEKISFKKIICHISCVTCQSHVSTVTCNLSPTARATNISLVCVKLCLLTEKNYKFNSFYCIFTVFFCNFSALFPDILAHFLLQNCYKLNVLSAKPIVFKKPPTPLNPVTEWN